MSQYDGDEFYARRNLLLADSAGISVAGTAAADTELIRLPITDAITIDKCRIVAMTGGTAVGPTLQLGKSLGGTGAVTSIGTKAIGTSANNTGLTMTVTSTTFVAGDHLVLSNVAGTSASTPKVIVNIGYVETFNA